MRFFLIVVMTLTTFVLTACGGPQVPVYTGPEVTEVRVFKGKRKMYLMHGSRTLKVYDFELGFQPKGHKTQVGDGRTPEGRYIIDRKNPRSKYYLSLGISYPNRADIVQARARGVDPGGDIFIHGTPSRVLGDDDWTAGCIAVTNEEIIEIYSMVNVGTVVTIKR